MNVPYRRTPIYRRIVHRHREDFLRRLLQVEKLVHEIGPDSIKDIPLITMDELKLIRQIWLDEFHESRDVRAPHCMKCSMCAYFCDYEGQSPE